jgi:hypothetical protein
VNLISPIPRRRIIAAVATTAIALGATTAASANTSPATPPPAPSHAKVVKHSPGKAKKRKMQQAALRDRPCCYFSRVDIAPFPYTDPNGWHGYVQHVFESDYGHNVGPAWQYWNGEDWISYVYA